MSLRRSSPLILLAALAGCGDKEGDTAAHDGGDLTGGDACAALQDGRWQTGGACFGHEMDAQLTFDADSCSFTLTDWSMDMDAPTGGTVTDDEITLAGDGWGDCAGAVDAEGDSLTGVCASSGCAFSLTLQ